jgi:hypothetical protein
VGHTEAAATTAGGAVGRGGAGEPGAGTRRRSGQPRPRCALLGKTTQEVSSGPAAAGPSAFTVVFENGRVTEVKF